MEMPSANQPCDEDKANLIETIALSPNSSSLIFNLREQFATSLA
jgi:hypothetical protein